MLRCCRTVLAAKKKLPNSKYTKVSAVDVASTRDHHEKDLLAAVRKVMLIQPTVKYHKEHWDRKIAAGETHFRECQKREQDAKKILRQALTGKLRRIPDELCTAQRRCSKPKSPAGPRTGFATFVQAYHDRAIAERNQSWLGTDNNGRLALASALWSTLPESDREKFRSTAKKNVLRETLSKVTSATVNRLKHEREVEDARSQPIKKHRPTIVQVSKVPTKGFSRFVLQKLKDKPVDIASFLSSQEKVWKQMPESQRNKYL